MQTMQPITATGTQGFLQWLAQFQPAVYTKIAPELPRKAPQLFSQFEASGGLGAYMQRQRLALAGLSDAATDASSIGLQPIDLTAIDQSQLPDVASAANPTPPDTSSAGWLSSLINGVSSAFLTVNQAQQQSAIVNAQLQRAQAGLPPLTVTTSAAGLPLISSSTIFGLPTSTVLIGGALLIGGYLLLGRKKRG
jgi:hypothetical protein